MARNVDMVLEVAIPLVPRVEAGHGQSRGVRSHLSSRVWVEGSPGSHSAVLGVAVAVAVATAEQMQRNPTRPHHRRQQSRGHAENC